MVTDDQAGLIEAAVGRVQARRAAAREGIDAFLQRRPADFSKTG